MQIYRGAVQTEQILKSYSVNKSMQYELLTSFSSHTKY